MAINLIIVLLLCNRSLILGSRSAFADFLRCSPECLTWINAIQGRYNPYWTITQLAASRDAVVSIGSGRAGVSSVGAHRRRLS